MKKDRILYAKTNKSIENNLEILVELDYHSETIIKISKDESQNTVFLLFPLSSKNNIIKLYVADEINFEFKDSYFIPANQAKIIYCEPRNEKRYYAYNNMVAIKSPYKNMRAILSNEKEPTDYIIQNYLSLFVYIEKQDKDCTITLTKYIAKYSFYGAVNPYSYNAYFNEIKNYYYYNQEINLDNYSKLSQINIGIKSWYVPYIEFYNFYLNRLNIKFNIYIRQIYGGSELYECNADDFDQKNLISLTTPISNIKCKNKKSLFNHLWSSDGTRIITGYIAPDSYFDIYVENKDDKNTDINLSTIMVTDTKTNNNAKYLKKDVTYNLKFNLNHLIKLEPGFNAEIEIKNSQNTFNINSQNPTKEIIGEGYTIKSNNDAMVYFYGRLNDNDDQKRN